MDQGPNAAHPPRYHGTPHTLMAYRGQDAQIVKLLAALSGRP